MLKHNQIYRPKEGFGPPDRYLGANVDKVQLEDGRTVWSMTCVEYLSRAIKNINLMIEGNKSALYSFRDGTCPYHSSHRT